MKKANYCKSITRWSYADTAFRNSMLAWFSRLKPEICKPYIGRSYQVIIRGKSKLVYPFEACPDWFMDALAREAGFESHDKSLIQNRLLTIYLSKIAEGK